MNLKPLFDRVVIKDAESEETTKSGIILTNSAKEKPQYAYVIAVGPGGVVDGKEITMQVKEGQKVVYTKYAGTEIKMNDEEYKILEEVSEIINSNITVDCTKCRYCVDTCSEDIDIARLFDLYNKHKMLEKDDWTQHGNAYLNYSKLPDVGIASDCIECEVCLEECPQQINIPEVLKDVAKTFETEIYGFEN